MKSSFWEKFKNQGCLPLTFCFFCFYLIFSNMFLNSCSINLKFQPNESNKNFKILSSYENQDLEQFVKDYAKKNKISVEFTYMGDLDIVSELNDNSKKYDAVWISNSIWLYMLDNTYTTSESKSISISPVVMGIKKSKAEALNLVNRDVYNSDLLELIKNKQIKYVMSSVTQTNTGATAYLGFLNALAGSPEVLSEKMLEDENLISDMINVFSGVERVSGDEDYLEKMFLNSDNYEAVIASESSLININKQLKEQNKEPLYLIYPKDGVAVNDSTFAYIDNGSERKKKQFKTIQSFLLSNDGQNEIQELGRRTWYGGISLDVNKNIFNPEWGINTNKYLITTKYPSKSVMTKAINLYIEELRKPTHVVFCLDYSGSMDGEGINQLINSMDYILTYEKAAKDKLQFSKKDKITVITFSSRVNSVISSSNGQDTLGLISSIKNEKVGGTTALYDAIIYGLDILNSESDDYTKTIIAMTDGEVNVGSFVNLRNKYQLSNNIPIYSITFGFASEEQLNMIANLSNAKVFDGKTNLLEAFKEVRGYN